MILGFGEGAQWQCWHLFAGLDRRQPLSIAPATRVTLLDLSPTNLSADALCGRKTSGHSLSGICTAKVPTGDLKMGGGKPLAGCYNARGSETAPQEEVPNFQHGLWVGALKGDSGGGQRYGSSRNRDERGATRGG